MEPREHEGEDFKKHFKLSSEEKKVLVISDTICEIKREQKKKSSSAVYTQRRKKIVKFYYVDESETMHVEIVSLMWLAQIQDKAQAFQWAFF